jgi:hypothetical protein
MINICNNIDNINIKNLENSFYIYTKFIAKGFDKL